MLKRLDKILIRVNTLYDRLDEPWRIIAAMTFGGICLRLAWIDFWLGVVIAGVIIMVRTIYGDTVVVKHDLSQHRE